MPAKRKNTQAEAMAQFYAEGWSLSRIAAAHSVSRQAVHKMLARRSIPMRHIEPLPFIEWQGRKFTLRENGYYAETHGRREYLHRAVWRSVNGKIPQGHDVHHLDGDKTNNKPGNLQAMTPEDHGRAHGFGGNGYTGSLGTRPVR